MKCNRLLHCFLLIFAIGKSSGLFSQQHKSVLPNGLSWFKNIEQVAFCVPIPLKEYRLQPQEEKAKFLFTGKKDAFFTIQVQGLHRSNDTVSLETYYQNSIPDEEKDPGKVVLRKKLLKKNNCFYFYGYMSNFIYKARFLEIVWLRKKDVVTMQIHYPIEEEKLWEKRLKTILDGNSFCK